MSRRDTHRIITQAELTGVPDTIPLKGPIRSKTGTIRGKRNAVRAKLEVLTVGLAFIAAVWLVPCQGSARLFRQSDV